MGCVDSWDRLLPFVQRYVQEVVSENPQERLAITIDIDHTVGAADSVNQWQPIAPIQQLCRWLSTRHPDILRFFITARESWPGAKRDTEDDLRFIHVKGHELILSPFPYCVDQGNKNVDQDVSLFKYMTRKRLAMQHHCEIILNIGNMPADLMLLGYKMHSFSPNAINWVARYQSKKQKPLAQQLCTSRIATVTKTMWKRKFPWKVSRQTIVAWGKTVMQLVRWNNHSQQQQTFRLIHTLAFDPAWNAIKVPTDFFQGVQIRRGRCRL